MSSVSDQNHFNWPGICTHFALQTYTDIGTVKNQTEDLTRKHKQEHI